MKSFIKKYLLTPQYQLLLWGFMFLSSCQLLEVEENFTIKNEDGEITKLEVSFGESSDFNLSSTEGAFVNLIFESNQEFNGNVKVYVSVDSTENESVLVSTVESVPSELVLDIEDIRQAFQDEDEDEEEDLEDGDLLFFTFQATINDESYQFNNTALSSGIICNSMISTADDIWIGTANANNGASFPITATAENIQIIPLGDDNYLISDISAGWFEAIGFRAQQEGIYNDNCNQITWVEPGQNRQFNFVDSGIEGSWDPPSQTLTIYWFDEGNNFSGESIFTKN
ncbi:hypothetical protein [Marivirga sp.]|uniref:hypothetical protein n=1 Tax=Marivirga sp. TaxID=2018662 RepID=UPI0025D8296E|nr:hypothetical protein [Marivirga sp.]